MRARARKTAIFVLALRTCLSFGQNATPVPTAPAGVTSTTTASYRIAGRTVSAVDGHPLEGATVLISNTKTQRLVASTLKTYSLSVYGASAFRIVVSVLPFLLPLFVPARLRHRVSMLPPRVMECCH
jgi:hypothetical protein